MAVRGTAIASDFDGTLCTSNWVTGETYFDPVDLEAIARYQSDGGLFGICTGRPLMSIDEEVEGKVSLDFYIVATGALVLDGNRNVLLEREISRDVAQKLVDCYACEEVAVLAISEQDFVAVRYDMAGMLPVVQSIDEVRGKLYDISVECYGDEDAARVVCKEINERFGGAVSAFQNLGSVDVVPAGCSKGMGVQVVRDALGASRIAGIGDSYNDLPLLAAADVAYTFETSPEEVRSAADVTVSKLADAIEHFSRSR